MLAHIDADAFFASALQRRHPELRGKPLLALGMGGGCVIAASYEAKAKGVKTGMRLKDARKLCPEAAALPSDFDEALMASRQIESILEDQCPVIQRYSVDEWFLDLRSLPNGNTINLQNWASSLQDSVKRKVALSVSVGIGPSKLLAKMASEYHKPAGLTIVRHASTVPRQARDDKLSMTHTISINDFLKDRPAAAIPGIGSRRSLHSSAHGWKTAWDIAHADMEEVRRLFGRPGNDMQRELRGEMVEKVEVSTAPPKSISRCRSFRATSDKMVIFSHLLDHLTYTMIKMRRHNLMCSAVAVWLRNGEYKHESKDTKLPQLMNTEEQLLPYIESCFRKLYAKQPHCTQVGLALLGLRATGGSQYSLFDDPLNVHRAEQIQQTLDSVHQKYGRDAIGRGSSLPTKSGRKKKLHVYT